MSDPLPDAPNLLQVSSQPVIDPSVAYAVFSDNVNQATVQRIFNAVAVGMSNNVKDIHFLFQSSGGYVGDGICLYNFLKTPPIDLTIYNAGSVQSISLIAFLGAKKRKTSPRSVFMMHRTSSGAQPATGGAWSNHG